VRKTVSSSRFSQTPNSRLRKQQSTNNLLSPDRVLIGSSETEDGLSAAHGLADVYAAWVPRSQIITIDLFSSELSKLAANVILAQRVSNASALSIVCEATGTNIDQVVHAVGRDNRIGPHMLRALFGFGGSCFKKDILSLV
jgi:UDPglucose 6-dehydrogenase